MFLIACIVVYLLMVAFAPDGLRVAQHRALGVSYSVLIAFLGYFTCGSTKFVAESEKSGLVKVGVCLFVALVAGVGMYLLWEAGLAPVQRLSEG